MEAPYFQNLPASGNGTVVCRVSGHEGVREVQWRKAGRTIACTTNCSEGQPNGCNALMYTTYLAVTCLCFTHISPHLPYPPHPFSPLILPHPTDTLSSSLTPLILPHPTDTLSSSYPPSPPNTPSPPSPGSRYSVLPDGSLRISVVNHGDRGLYECHVSNPAGQQTTSIEVTGQVDS